MKLLKNLKKQFAISLIILVLFVQLFPSASFAQEAPSAPQAPSAPTAPQAPTAPEAPSAPQAPEAPTAPQAPTAPEKPSINENNDPSEQNANEQDNHRERERRNRNKNEEGGNTGTTNNTTEQDQTNLNSQPLAQSTGQDTGGQSGNATIDTGNATTTGVIKATGNLNASASPSGGSGGASVSNTDNGTGSSNTGSIGIVNNNTTDQTNTANINNSMILDSNSGKNSTSSNTGENSTINTGDANTTGTVITGVNTNVDGVAVSEFNIADDHTGNIILDFGSNCIAGCTLPTTSVSNTGNGESSTNDASVDSLTNNNTFQTNNADVESSLVLSANSGKNNADRNTGGDSSITTGDANVAANALTFVNNNIAGNVVLGVVNIFGNLVGDIIIPDNYFQMCSTCATGSLAASNTGNGSNTTNTSNISQTTNDSTFQTNDATITNNLILDAQTGDNSASRNTGGTSSIETGNTNVQANVLNIANSNIISDGVWWLAIVNQAGTWIGKIIGAPDGSTMAGSAGTEFVVNPDGSITAINSGNGDGSTNNTNVTQTTNNTTVQSNTANIVNNLDLSANTGENSTSRNTNGNNSIVTGDAQIIANLINFVNNNITGNGKLIVTLINVFGSWTGDLITPGQTKTAKSENNGQNNIGGENSNNSSSTTAQNNPSNGTVAGTSTGTTSLQATSNSSNGNLVIAAGVFTNAKEKSQSLVKGVSNLTNDAKQKISINLAWGILLLPIAILIVFRRKLVKFAKALPL